MGVFINVMSNSKQKGAKKSQPDGLTFLNGELIVSRKDLGSCDRLYSLAL